MYNNDDLSRKLVEYWVKSFVSVCVFVSLVALLPLSRGPQQNIPPPPVSLHHQQHRHHHYTDYVTPLYTSILYIYTTRSAPIHIPSTTTNAAQPPTILKTTPLRIDICIYIYEVLSRNKLAILFLPAHQFYHRSTKRKWLKD